MSKKRAFLKTTGALGIAGLAGCFGLPLLASDEDPEDDTASESDSEESDSEESDSEGSDSEEASKPQYNLVEEFKFEADNTFEVTPAVAGDVVLAPNTDRNLYAVNTKSGELLWSHKFNEEIGATPAANGNQVYTNMEPDNDMYSFDKNSGDINWEINPEYTFHSESPAYNGEYLFVTSDGVKAYNGGNGQEEWNFNFDGTLYTSSAPKITEENVVNTSEYGVFAVNQDTGSKEWTFEGAGEALPSSLVTNQNNVVYSDDSNTVYIIDSKTGTVTREISTSGQTSNLSLIGDILYYDNDGLTAFDVNKMSEVWNMETSVEQLSSKTLDGYIFGMDYRSIVGIDISNGNKELSKSIDRIGYNVNPIIVGNHVVVPNSSNALVGYQIDSN